MVFITAGMGGGTGTGGAPIVAKIAKEMGILTVGIVTKPFKFEGNRRMQQAEVGINKLREYVDALVVIPNERLKLVADTPITSSNAFDIADDVLKLGVSSISDLINLQGYVNLDFADITAVMKNAGFAHMGIGIAEGENMAEEAAKKAIYSPLIETSIEGATGVIISIVSSPDIQLDDVEKASNMIKNAAHADANIIWGTSFDSNMTNEVRVTVIATGFDNTPRPEYTEEAAAEPAVEQEVKPVAEPAPAPAYAEMQQPPVSQYQPPVQPQMPPVQPQMPPQQPMYAGQYQPQPQEQRPQQVPYYQQPPLYQQGYNPDYKPFTPDVNFNDRNAMPANPQVMQPQAAPTAKPVQPIFVSRKPLDDSYDPEFEEHANRAPVKPQETKRSDEGTDDLDELIRMFKRNK